MSHRKHPRIIAIDGPVASGKTTTGRLLAERLGWLCFDTGITYRAYAYAYLAVREEAGPGPDVAGWMEEVGLCFLVTAGQVRAHFRGVDVSAELWTEAVSHHASQLSTLPLVRLAMVRVQRALVDEQDAVVVGRDIATVVFPQADLKVYLDATPEERARRRFKELQAKGQVPTYETIYRDVLARDKRDKERASSPLSKAPDSKILNNTHCSPEQQVQIILHWYYEKIGKITAGTG